MNKREARNRYYDNTLKAAVAISEGQANKAMRKFCQTDLFYLLTRGLGRTDVNRDWLFARCEEIQASPDGFIDLWAREHYKSTVITYAQSIQDILNDPNITIGIFSHTKPIARAFLRQIKYELETNARLKYLFPEILYENCKKAPNWSEDKGITVKRTSNSKEATVEAHGLIDGQPTSKHFSLLVYDDVVTRESVTTPEMIEKVTDAWSLSLNLGAEGGSMRIIGTRYHFNDTYRTIMQRKAAVPRIYPATDDGKVDGEPVFLTRAVLEKKRREQGSFVFACQQLQNPKADDAQGFNLDDMRYYETEPDPFGMNFYILVDPANEKRKKSDYTTMWVLGLGPDRNYYVFDLIRDKLNLTERCDTLMQLHQEYQPIGVGYEHYGIQADIQHIEYVQGKRNYRFPITPLGGQMAKNDRIRRLIPIFESHRLWFPRTLYRTNYEGKREELIKVFLEDEMEAFPVMLHDDMLDGLARVVEPDLAARFPKMKKRIKKASWRDRLKDKARAGGKPKGFMAA